MELHYCKAACGSPCERNEIHYFQLTDVKMLEKARELIRSCHGHNAVTLIGQLNPVLRGWANYHRNVVSKRIYGRVDYMLRGMLWRWARRSHPNKSRGWLQRRYFSADEHG